MTATERIAELEQLVARLDRQLTELSARNRLQQTEIVTARNNANHWKKRFEMVQNNTPTASSIVFELSEENMEVLHREAVMRHMQPRILSRRLVETVVKDKLFGAVLDQ